MTFELIKFVLQYCYTGLIGFIFLTVFIFADKTFSARILRIFFFCIFTSFVLLVEDSADYYCQVNKIFPELYPWFAAVGFSARVCAVGFTAAISNRREQKFHKTIYILMLVNAILAFLSVKFELYFGFPGNKYWFSKKLFCIPYLICAFYVFLIFRTAISHFRTNVLESAIVIIISLTSLTSNLLELFSLQKLVLAQTFIICIIFYYLTLNVQLYKQDALTNLLNRRTFYIDSLRYANYTTMIISMDLNDLKKLNDTKGHSEGDKALVKVSEVMLDSFKCLGRIYRTGGDEFMVLIKNKNPEKTLNAISSFKKSVEKTPYSVALGYAEYHPGENFEQVTALSDKLMYENKRQIKAMQQN